MTINFYKYHGTGNDFVMLDGFDGQDFDRLTQDAIAKLCHRRFGIGADGLIILKPSETSDFFMDYFNADGRRSSLCGNGSRCAVKMSHELGRAGRECTFKAIDGVHSALVDENGWVGITMKAGKVEINNGDYILDTGSPHYVRFVKDLSENDIVETGRAIRYSDQFRSEGINVNLVEVKTPQHLGVATYERGVEDETYSCGTGVTAAAVVHIMRGTLENGLHQIDITTKGGRLRVDVEVLKDQLTDVKLLGPAERVYMGQIAL